MKHTPGPWHWHDEKDGYNLAGKGAFENGDILSCRGRRPSEPDRTLIAAAPDLLEACKRALTELCACADRMGTDIKTFMSYDDLKKSIAKAEGRIKC